MAKHINEVHDALRDALVALVERDGEALDAMGKIAALLSASVRIARRHGRAGTLAKALRIAIEAMEGNPPHWPN